MVSSEHNVAREHREPTRTNCGDAFRLLFWS